MGNCVSPQYEGKGGSLSRKFSVNVIDMEGKLQQLKEPIKAGHVLSQNPNCFISSLESMCVGSPIPQMGPSEDLRFGRFYFLFPLSKSHTTLSLQDLCALAIKADSALARSHIPSASNSTASDTSSVSRKSSSVKHKNMSCISLRSGRWNFD
ncbi:hypothetical protein QN277_005117 [Acacia crassicarpa]|uniref:Uncharacterized protein n=1 Tax=Acacia crassicarpa TaxID=499986 RepID=A0AAE1JSU3_9FABA|nr:hypothetical protein QN277_005117 [Acacia crassicarpa]